MTRIVLALVLSFCLAACNADEVQGIKDNGSNEKVWAFMQFNVPFKGGDFEDYWYYGKISQSLYQRIKSNQVNTGFIFLENVKYWGNDDLVYDYADGEYAGEVVFRIEDIRRITLIKKAPIAGQGYEQFEQEVIEEVDIEKRPPPVK